LFLKTPNTLGTKFPCRCNSTANCCSWHNAYQMQQWTIFLSVNKVPDFTPEDVFQSELHWPAFCWHCSQGTFINSRVFAGRKGYDKQDSNDVRIMFQMLSDFSDYKIVFGKCTSFYICEISRLLGLGNGFKIDLTREHFLSNCSNTPGWYIGQFIGWFQGGRLSSNLYSSLFRLN